jgi:hypothetical protein
LRTERLAERITCGQNSLRTERLADREACGQNGLGTKPLADRTATFPLANSMDWRISAGTRYYSFLRNVHAGSGAHRTSCSMDTGVHPRGYGDRGAKLATHFQLVLILIPLLLLCAGMCCCNLREQIDLRPFSFSC